MLRPENLFPPTRNVIIVIISDKVEVLGSDKGLRTRTTSRLKTIAWYSYSWLERVKRNIARWVPMRPSLLSLIVKWPIFSTWNRTGRKQMWIVLYAFVKQKWQGSSCICCELIWKSRNGRVFPSDLLLILIEVYITLFIFIFVTCTILGNTTYSITFHWLRLLWFSSPYRNCIVFFLTTMKTFVVGI